MDFKSSRLVVLALVVASIGLLIPGLYLPVLSIRGVLTKDGVASVAPTLIEQGLNADTVNSLKSMLNPAVVGLVQATGGDLRKMIIEKLTPQVVAALQKGVENVEVYEQTRSILGSVQRLYEVGSPVPATLILLFSVIVPFGKAGLVTWALFLNDPARRRSTLKFVESIAKWSMRPFTAVIGIVATSSSAASCAPCVGEMAIASSRQATSLSARPAVSMSALLLSCLCQALKCLP